MWSFSSQRSIGRLSNDSAKRAAVFAHMRPLCVGTRQNKCTRSTVLE